MGHINKIFNFVLALIATIGSPCLAQTKFDLPDRLNISIIYDELGRRFDKYNPVSLAEGKPELFPPTFLLESLSNVSVSQNLSIHEYMPAEGSEELRNEVALFYSALINRPLNKSGNVVITMGATGGIFMSVAAHTKPGDEWVVLEPAFEEYYISVKISGGVIVPVPLRRNSSKDVSDSFSFNKTELSNAFNSKTKGIFINNPHNPTGKLFTREELQFIGELAIKWNTIIVVDEVYEWTTYNSSKLIRIASLGDAIFNRTITVSSMSKTFFGSGFRIGWAYGPSKLINNVDAQQRFVDFARNSYAQIAAAEAINKIRLELATTNKYLKDHISLLEQKRDFVVKALVDIGMKPINPDSGFFIYANWTSLSSVATGWENEQGPTKDWKFVGWLVKNTGVLTVPGSGLFLKNTKLGEDYIRFCFAKGTDKLNQAVTLLAKLKRKIDRGSDSTENKEYLWDITGKQLQFCPGLTHSGFNSDLIRPC